MTYLEKLKDPRWQKKRLEVLQRDNWTCQSCGEKEKTLHVHHWYYVKNQDPWEYDVEGLSAVCEECHEAETFFRKDLEGDLLKYFKECHFFYDDLINLANLINAKIITPKELIERRKDFWRTHRFLGEAVNE